MHLIIATERLRSISRVPRLDFLRRHGFNAEHFSDGLARDCPPFTAFQLLPRLVPQGFAVHGGKLSADFYLKRALVIRGDGNRPVHIDLVFDIHVNLTMRHGGF